MPSASTIADVFIPPETNPVPLRSTLGPRTLYAEFSQTAARFTLTTYFLVMIALMIVAMLPSRNNIFEGERLAAGKGDIRLYLDTVDRMRSGENYYQASLIELERHGYPMSSVFNWRPPVIMWLVSLLPQSSLGVWLIGPLAALLMAATLLVMGDDREGGSLIALAALFLVFSTVAQAFNPAVFILPDTWSGVLIGLSMCCFARHRTRTGIALGIAAAVLRELAIGYALTMLVYSILYRQWRELAGWMLGIAMFMACYALHAWQVWQTIDGTEVAQAKSWIALGGLTFLLATAQMNVILINWPQWLTAVYLATGLLGLAGWHTPFGRRVLCAAGAYQLLFLVAGQPVNQYWGVLIAPLLAMGVARGLLSLNELWQQCWKPVWHCELKSC